MARSPRPRSRADGEQPAAAVDATLTRARFVRRAAGAGIGLALAGGVAGVEVLGGSGSPRRRADAPRPDAASATATPVRSFYSRPDLRPPVITARHDAASTAAGLLFLAPFEGRRQAGPLIVDDRGEPLWFRPAPPGLYAMNLRVASYQGRPVLTWWEGKTTFGLGEGEHVIADASYTEIGRFPAANGLPSDLHEFILTPQGTALVTSYEKLRYDLTPVNGPRHGRVVGSILQEIDVASGRLLFEWRSLDHIPITEAYHGSATDPYDYFHLNAIDLTPSGNLLLSARNTWAVYEIDRGSGEVVWRLGGKRSDFAMGPGTAFAWQHDARYHEGEGGPLISLFDDGAAPQAQSQSRGLVVALDMKRMRATLERTDAHLPRVLAQALGSVQQLANGNWLVGWGTAPYTTEYAPDGRVVLDLELPKGRWNYRALRFPWVGRPLDRPSVASRRLEGSMRIYASWNGATEVASWQLLSGRSAELLRPVGTTPRSGFETVLAAPAGSRYAAAVALDRAGNALATSETLRL